MTTPAALASVGGDTVAVVLGLEPAWPAARAIGPALTVQGAPGDNLALHYAVADARPGELVVLAVGGERSIAHCGGIVATAARRRGVAGLLLDGAVRDRAELAEIGLPVFHLGTSPRKPGKGGPVALRVAIEICGVRVEPGDLVAADADGVVVVPRARADELLAAAAELDARDREILAELDEGRTTVEIYGYAAL